MHGFLVCGFLPIQVSFPVIAAALLGPNIHLEDGILIRSFVEHVNICDSVVLKAAFQEVQSGVQSFSDKLQSNLISVLSQFSCRQLPSPSSFRVMLTNVAKHEFLVKPLGALYGLNSGIPKDHIGFWKDVTVERLLCVYYSLHATPDKVLKVIKEPQYMSMSEQTVFGYLLRYVGNMKVEEVRRFLRFVTGSSALTVEEIKVQFNSLSGLSRRPIAHTCASSLELSTTYSTCIEFCEEFTAILSNEFSWIMDAI